MALNRTLAATQAVIELLAANGPLGPADIAAATGVARSSVYRLAEGLAAVGLAEILPDSRVKLSNRWLHLADAVQPAMTEWRTAQKVLDDLAGATGQTTFLTVPRGDQAICIAWSQGGGIDLLVLKPGRTLPLYAGAAGRNILAYSPSMVPTLLDQAPLPALTTRTIVAKEDILSDIETTVREGYTFSDEDVTIGIGAIGAPVWYEGQFMGCLSVAGLIHDINERRRELVTELKLAAKMIGSPNADDVGRLPAGRPRVQSRWQNSAG